MVFTVFSSGWSPIFSPFFHFPKLDIFFSSLTLSNLEGNPKALFTMFVGVFDVNTLDMAHCRQWLLLCCCGKDEELQQRQHGPAKPKIFTVWISIEKVCQLLLCLQNSKIITWQNNYLQSFLLSIKMGSGKRQSEGAVCEIMHGLEVIFWTWVFFF